MTLQARSVVYELTISSTILSKEAATLARKKAITGNRRRISGHKKVAALPIAAIKRIRIT